MTLLLPNLDDRTWADLAAEGTALIPVYGPEWTDQNYSDPGITLIELLAFVAEMDIYQLNQVSDRDRLKFLSLVGVAPRPPIAAEVVLKFTLASGSAPVTLPAGLEFAGTDPFGVKTLYRIREGSTLAAGDVAALQLQNSAGYQNLTPIWRRGAVMSLFGSAPQPGVAFYLGLTSPLPVGVPVQFFFTLSGGHSGFDERRRILCQADEIARNCPPVTDNPCQNKISDPVAPPAASRFLKHYGVRTVWEYQTSVGGQTQWLALDPSQGQVIDDTRALTLNGSVIFSVPQAMASATVGAVAAPYYYVRCRIDVGAYDAAPLLQYVAFNGICAEQINSPAMSFTIAPNATIVYSSGVPPQPDDLTTLFLTLDERQWITQLRFGGGSSTDPQFRILSFTAPAMTSAGTLCFEGVFLGLGDGLPDQQFLLPDAPIEPVSVRLYTLEGSAWKNWELRTDFDASNRKDFHAVLDATAGTVGFGTGEKGRVPPDGCEIFALYTATRAQAGNLAAGAINALADSPHNHALLFDPTTASDGWTKLNGELSSVTNPLAATGGMAAETIAQAAGRADQLVESSGRAVSLADYERLALRTPGTQIARVTAIANMHPSFPCLEAPGMITVIVLPYLPPGSPMPTPGLLQTVAAYLRPRRVIGSRVEVVGPTYLEVAVQASVQSQTGTNKSNFQQAIIKALNIFLDPLVGGADGTGWPFGRDVYRSEIMKVIDAVAGVDYIVSLALLANGGQPQCGNVCLSSTWLVQAGAHQITVS